MKSGIKTIIIGAVVFILGAVVVPVLCILPFLQHQHDQTQFKIPGKIEIAVQESGRYYLWNDFQTIYDGRTFSQSEHIPDGLNIQITDSSGRKITFVGNTSISFSSGSSARDSIGYVEIEKPGKITVQVSGNTEERIFSFSKSRLLKMFLLLLAGFGGSAIIALTGLGLVIWGIWRQVKFVKKTS